MKILLIYPRSNDILHNASLPLGLISIGTYLKNANHEVEILDMDHSQISVKKVIDKYKPDLCGVSVRSTKQLSSALRVSRIIKNKKIPVVWGGPFISIPILDHIFESGVVDIVSFSEGEMTWVDLAEAIENNKPLNDIKGIAYQSDGRIVKTKKREFMDLNNVLPCDWSLVDVPKYFQHLYGAKKLVYLYMSKGCPGHCAFCYNNDFHDSCIRRKSVKTFMQELNDLIENYDIDGFYLADEFAFSKKSDLYDLCDALDKLKSKLIWGFETRIGLLNKDDLKRSYDSGCCCIHFGIETASQKMIDKVGKNIPFEKIVPTFEDCNEIGIIPVSTFIIGLPGETVEDLKITVDFIKKLPSNEISVMQYGYIHNTAFGREIYNSGRYNLPRKLTEYKKIDVYYNRLENFSDIPSKDLKVIQGYFFWNLLLKKDYKEYPNKEKGFVVLKKHIEIVLRRIFYTDFVDLPEAICKSAGPFIRFFIAANFYKKVLSKYGLQ